jgi:hypothetical protein
MVKNIEMLLSDFLDTYGVHLMLVCSLAKLERDFIGYVDSDFAADLDRRRSLACYVFTVGGCAVSWRACL